MTETSQVFESRISRRRLLGVGLAAAAVAACPLRGVSRVLAATTSLDNAFSFLDGMMDLHASGSTLRLAQSYVPTSALDLGSEAFTYDNAVLILAYLKRNDVSRATVLGDSLIRAQKAETDGRVRNAYYTDPFTDSNGSVTPSNLATTTGNVAWAGIALVKLYNRTHAARHLKAAQALASWIGNNAVDRGNGFTGGLDAGDNAYTWKSTEHNIDAFVFFHSLATVTGSRSLLTQAHNARSFVESMWNDASGYFYTGTGDDGITVNTDAVPEDVQSWSYLAFADSTYSDAVNWVVRNLNVTEGNFTGVSFDSSDRSAVWFEGTSHMVAALKKRRLQGDRALAASYLDSLRLAQQEAPNTDGNGIVAASRDSLTTVDGDHFYAALHTGATAWYCLAHYSNIW